MTDYHSIEKEHAVHLERKTRPELLDLLQRQVKILANRGFIEKLPDRGEKLKKLKSSIEDTIKKLDAVDDVTNLVRNMGISSRVVLDSDDDDDDNEQEPDVYTTLATNGIPKKVMRNVDHNLPFVEKLTQQVEQKQSSNAHRHERLPLNKSVKKSTKEKVDDNWNRIQGTWIETAVTPPPATFKESKEINLRESYELQKAHVERQKELQSEIAAKYLRLHLNTGVNTLPSYDSSSFTSYREFKTVEIGDDGDN